MGCSFWSEPRIEAKKKQAGASCSGLLLSKKAEVQPPERDLVVCPAWAMAWRWKSSEELVAATQVNRKVPTARGALKEAG
jgi:hypothetical protein